MSVRTISSTKPEKCEKTLPILIVYKPSMPIVANNAPRRVSAATIAPTAKQQHGGVK